MGIRGNIGCMDLGCGIRAYLGNPEGIWVSGYRGSGAFWGYLGAYESLGWVYGIYGIQVSCTGNVWDEWGHES